MYHFFEVLSFLLQILSSVATILSVLITAVRGKSVLTNTPKESSALPYGYTEVFRWMKWVIIIGFLTYYCATCTLLCLTNVPNTALVSTIITLVIMILGFVFYAMLGQKSLNSMKVVAPKRLWMMLFKRIPSYIEETDGPFNIRIVKIGTNSRRIFSQHNVVDDYDIAVNHRISELIEQIIELKREQSFRKATIPLYNIIEDEDLFNNRNNHEIIHGIIVFIGNGLSEQTVRSKINSLADKFPDAAIGFYSFGTYPSDEDTPPYVNLNNLRVEDYVDHLVFRFVSRGREWQKLAAVYHKAVLVSFSLLIVLMLIAPIGLMVRNNNLDKSKLVLSAPENNGKSNITKLVNYLLVSPHPSDVKLWENDTVVKRIYNTYRYSEGGDTSTSQKYNTLIAEVLRAKVFLLYDVSQSNPYIVWTCDGKRCNGCYNKDNASLTVHVGDSTYSFKWVPSKKDRTTYDDRRIRLMYSYDGITAVEMIYAPTDSRLIKKAVKRSDTFFLDIQRFLVAANMQRPFQVDSARMHARYQRDTLSGNNN